MDKRGASSVEYVLLTMVAVAILVALIKFGPAIKSLFDTLNLVWPK
jgi:Flp pilus assembly pilin Flp